MRRLIALVAALAVLTSPVMARGKIDAQPDNDTIDVKKPGKDAKADKPDLFFRNCKEARAVGYSRMRIGEPGYAPHLDRDKDGIACE